MEPHDWQLQPQPFRQNIFQPTSPSRVSTEPQSASKKSHLHGLHHHHHKHHRARNAKDAVQSAVQLHPPTSFGDLLKQASRSKETSPSHSRRESVVKGNKDEEVNAAPPKPVRPVEVERERARVKLRENELRSSLQSLSDRSLKTSRRLDDTYYSILEKVSVLRQTIGSLQELSGLTKELHENFQTDTTELVEEIQGQFEGFNDFQSQEEQVRELEDRVKAGKEKADALTARLATARERVAARARADAEWEATTSRRLRMLWAVLGTVTALVFIAILFQQLKPVAVDRDADNIPQFALRDVLADAPIPEAAKEAIATPLIRTTPAIQQVMSIPSDTPESIEDDKLRIFDEL
ncbi:hypothetical protein K491DRAFT_685898 [Lophiostoma macrostomum CBS 122681]|uniref:Uncharacterized protein n=1 Tax=Lophiostoma macrostomum CBS 122681 TaxID=1314788 RepID=A0A6A6TU75_9PLEO|nr:hypothetical protein K491DRAFT_685898 [Lophiostoma macrostomum CBS 122681]